MNLREHLVQPDRPIDYVYFVQKGMVVSLVMTMSDGASVEVGTVGNEGMVGMGVYLEAIHVHHRSFAQIPGEATRIPADLFKQEMDRSEELRTVVHRYAGALMIQVMQGSACNRLHSVEARCARWLLMTMDRVGRETFPLTQEFLAQMLGIRRASVTVVAGMLQQAGIIRYIRGKLTIVDRQRLEATSCECYGIIRTEMDRLTDGH
ncbi:Crp/Fnr family transcriptional regulator [Polyangium aurulentum]|uniref:Crp/Fnr family transcriptional regulator n=1 Tax=Polyangium aurulentum TaxID=2567896 RepID=UPI00197EF581|nr:Crp/Fnr family transcriptional regulator [Polyangium aurulentum]UQA55404.1 Crp/Fnr family transcriptional regulator [Polyangium aurulentum]